MKDLKGKTTKTTEQTIYTMMTENTGKALCDSGDAYGRNWQKNQNKTIDDFNRQPEVSIDADEYGVCFTVNIWHLLNNQLELDDLCHEFNSIECDVWNGEYYGTNTDMCLFLDDNGFIAKGDAINTYNYDNNLSQILQFQYFERDDEQYVLLQVHGGCDARGGYTDAKLFKLAIDNMYFLMHDVYGDVKRGDIHINVSSMYDGVSLSIDDDDCSGEPYEWQKGDIINLELSEIC